MKQTFAVAAGHALTADAAAEALRAGGTAVDACFAAGLTAFAAEPVLAGFLGGGFMMVRDPEGTTKLLDFFVQTPRRKRLAGEIDFRAIEADFGTVRQEFHIGAGSIAAPGAAAGLWEAHSRLGRIPAPELAAPAIAAAQGHALSRFQARAMAIIGAICSASPETRAIYCNGDRLLKAGETIRNPAFADVLDSYAREGARFAQEGEAAQALLSLSADGGHLGTDDLKRYAPRWRTPLSVRRGSATVSMNPPPSLGGALIAFALDLAPANPTPADVAQALAATSRARVEAGINADPAAGALRLTDPDLVARYRREVAGRAAAIRGTTHVSVVDAKGMCAAMTLSNGEGCGLIAPGTGLMPNNMLGEDDLMPGGYHAWREDVRLSSMMCPTVVEWDDGRVAALGSGGSNRIRSAIAQAALRMIDGGARLDDAIGAPRVHAEKTPAVIDFEDRIGDAARAELLTAFPEARPWPEDSMFFGGVHAVRRDIRGGLEAAGDPRRDGVAVIG